MLHGLQNPRPAENDSTGSDIAENGGTEILDPISPDTTSLDTNESAEPAVVRPVFVDLSGHRRVWMRLSAATMAVAAVVFIAGAAFLLSERPFSAIPMPFGGSSSEQQSTSNDGSVAGAPGAGNPARTPGTQVKKAVPQKVGAATPGTTTGQTSTGAPAGTTAGGLGGSTGTPPGKQPSGPTTSAGTPRIDPPTVPADPAPTVDPTTNPPVDPTTDPTTGPTTDPPPVDPPVEPGTSGI